MSVMDDLRAIRWMSMELEKLRERMQILVEQAGYHGPVIRNCPSYGSAAGDGIGSYVARTEAMKADIQRRRDEINQRIYAVRDALQALETQQRLIMELHYIDGLKWASVAMALDRSSSWCRDQHNKAAFRLHEWDAQNQKKAPA